MIHLKIKPEVGVLWAFPSWLNHMVWPFSGDGERRTISMNVSMWTPEQLDPASKEIYDKIRGKDGHGNLSAGAKLIKND